MMPRLLLFPFLIISIWVGAQNLVLDPGFEIHNDPCTDNLPGLTYWFNPNTASPDLFSMNGCGSIISEIINQGIDTPFPFEGNSYVGLYCATTTQSVAHTREYLYTELSTPLIADQFYSVRFSVYRWPYFDLAIDKLGLAFTNYAPHYETFEVIPIEPQIETYGSFIQPDSSYWESFQFLYEAAGGEQFLTIGNFRFPNEMNVYITGEGQKLNFGYYLFDEIVVEEDFTSNLLLNKIELEAWYWNNHLNTNIPQRTEFCVIDLIGREVSRGSIDPFQQITDLGLTQSGIFKIILRSKENQRVLTIWKE